MKQLKMVAASLAATSCIITLLLYYRFHSLKTSPLYQNTQSEKIMDFQKRISDNPPVTNIPLKHVPLNTLYKDYLEDETSLELLENGRNRFMIKTDGCKIPLTMINYKYEKKERRLSCGKRAVFLEAFDTFNLRITIKSRAIVSYLRRSKKFNCCYQYLKRPYIDIDVNRREYTTCKEIRDGDIFKLETDFIKVKCFEFDDRNVTHIIYTDVYTFVKKIDLPRPSSDKLKVKYNVLMLGMDSMSLPRMVQALSRTMNFLNENSYLGFRGYHKVADNTFPNLIAVLTGKNLSTISQKCSGVMDQCNDLLIWNKFKELGYVTAYGEDYLRLPDTFNKRYAFRKPPTDHYMRPFFLQGETELYNKTLLCVEKTSSGQHLLNYAYQFANTYKHDSFFGLFWMNSFSHNANSRPNEADKMLENFFNQLTYTRILDRTFIIFFSDHGVRFGDFRIKVESYYDERAPGFLMWVPTEFKAHHPLPYTAAVVNQFRLLTPYDLHKTLIQIKNLSDDRNITEPVTGSCPKCHSIFQEASYNRTCDDVEIHSKWCSCHGLYPLNMNDKQGINAVIHVSSHLKAMVKKIRTGRCWGCMQLSLKNIIRLHFYYKDLNDKQKLYFVVAFSMDPGNVTYEATVLQTKGTMEIVGPVSVLSVYRGLGKCAMKGRDKLFCVCQKKEHC